MTTITLPPDLEDLLKEAARKLGTAPEALALESLRQRFAAAAAPDEPASHETLQDFLADFIGRISGSTEAWSEDCGRRFTEGMAEKQRDGRL